MMGPIDLLPEGGWDGGGVQAPLTFHCVRPSLKSVGREGSPYMGGPVSPGRAKAHGTFSGGEKRIIKIMMPVITLAAHPFQD